MTELIGNSARDGDVAWVRLEVAADRLVGATGEGPGVADLCGAVRGLTTLAG